MEVWKWCLRHRVVSAVAAAILLVLTSTYAFRAGHRHLLFQSAMRYYRRGVTLYRDKVQRASALRSLRQAHVLKEPAPMESRLQGEVTRLQRAEKHEFDFALMLFMQAFSRPEETMECRYVRDIFERRVRYSLMSMDYDEIEDQMRALVEVVARGDEAGSPRVAAFERWVQDLVRGDGTLTVHSTPEAELSLVPLVEMEPGRLVPGRSRSLGRTPVRDLVVPKGSYVLDVRVEGRPPVLYAVRIDHGENEVVRCPVPRRGPADCVYVPGGPFYTGGTHALYHRLHERYVPGFFLSRREVTFGEYVSFWLDPAGANRAEDARARIRWSADERCFQDAWDEAGVLAAGIHPDFPVVGITREAAARYCRWRGRHLGRPCRLPTAWEWEKAARGADGRDYPWGDGFDPAWAFLQANERSARVYRYWAPGEVHPYDRSVYGAMDMAGNVREWTSSPFPGSKGLYQIKGGSSSTPRRFGRCAHAGDAPLTPSDVGFRYVVPLLPEDI